MNISHCHVQFWQARPLPAFAVAFYTSKRGRMVPEHVTRRGLIDACVNAHAGISYRVHLDAGNFVSLLRLWRRNAENGAHNPPETLRGFLFYLWRKDSNTGRANIAGRVLRKLNRSKNA